MKQNIILIKSEAFSKAIAVICHSANRDQHTKVLTLQLLRSGTSVGAMVRESVFAESKKDFIHKLRVALKEINESIHWIELLHTVQAIDDKTYTTISAEAIEIRKISIAIIKTSAKSIKN